MTLGAGTQPDFRPQSSMPMLRAILVVFVLSAPVALLAQSPYARAYPAAVIVGLLARGHARRNVQVAVVAGAVVSGPIVWHLATPGTAAQVIAALLDTSSLGAIDYVREFLLDATPLCGWLLLAYMVLVGFVVVGLARARGWSLSGARATAAGVVLAGTTIATATPSVLERTGEIRHAWDQTRRSQREEMSLLRAAAIGSSRLQARSLTSRRPDLTVVLYIGESTTKWNWSLYGYPRETNAPLARHAASGRFLTLANATSVDAHPSSAPSAGVSTLSFLHRRTPQGVLSLSGVLGRAGVATAWIANPVRTGGPTRYYDHALLPQLRAALEPTGPGRLIVVETYAGHFSYCANIPRDRIVRWDDWIARLSNEAVWGRRRQNREALDCYDAAMHYVSSNVHELLVAVDASTRPTVVLYLSDHGEDVWRRTSRYSGPRSVRHREIPLLVYVNSTFADRYPDAVRAARANRSKAYTSAWLFDGVLDLFAVQGPGITQVFDSRNSLFSERFEPLSANPREVWGAVDVPVLRGDHIEAARRARAGYLNGGRLCAHRANTLFKYLEATAAFDCVEADIVLHGDAGGATRAFVFHPPGRGQPSRANPGLDLGGLLRNAGLPRTRLWLDVKNLTVENARGLLAEINAVVPPARRADVLVETPNLALARSPAAWAITAAGYTLSFYMPTQTGIRCAEQFDTVCERTASRLASALRGSAFTGLSFDARGARLAGAVRAAMPGAPVLNTWARRWPASAEELALLGQVQMYLVDMPGGFDY